VHDGILQRAVILSLEFSGKTQPRMLYNAQNDENQFVAKFQQATISYVVDVHSNSTFKRFLGLEQVSALHFVHFEGDHRRCAFVNFLSA
jgi:hypothetical protein